MEMHAAGRIEWRFPVDSSGQNERLFNDLPWQMLVPLRTTNLLVAGRCASMTHEGQSAARVSGACFVMGQAAGTAAAYLGQTESFQNVHVPMLKRRLIQDGCYLGGSVL